MLLLDKDSSDESMYDTLQNIMEDYHTLTKDLPKDEYGFIKGSFRIRIEWEDDENE